jgi:hypothetical protein
MLHETRFLCSICFKNIDLNKSKTDDRGRPVHEDCYTRMLLHQQLPLKRPVKKPSPWTTWMHTNH